MRLPRRWLTAWSAVSAWRYPLLNMTLAMTFRPSVLGRDRRDNPGTKWIREACSPDGAISAFTRVFDALWRHPGSASKHSPSACRVVHVATRRCDEFRCASNFRRRSCPSLRLDPGECDHLGPLLCFRGDELAKVSRRTRIRLASQCRVARPQVGIGKGRIDLRVELVDDSGGRALWRTDAPRGASLVARHEIAHGRQLGQRLGALRGRYCQRSQLAGPDVCDGIRHEVENDLHLTAGQVGDR